MDQKVPSFEVIEGIGFHKPQSLPIQKLGAYRKIKEGACGVLVSLTRNDFVRKTKKTYAYFYGSQISKFVDEEDENISMTTKDYLFDGTKLEQVKFGFSSEDFSTCFCVIGHDHKKHETWSGTVDFLLHLTAIQVPGGYAQGDESGGEETYVSKLLLKILGAVKKEVVEKSGSFYYQDISYEDDLLRVVKKLFGDVKMVLPPVIPDLCLLKLDAGTLLLSPKARFNIEVAIRKDLGPYLKELSSLRTGLESNSTTWKGRLSEKPMQSPESEGQEGEEMENETQQRAIVQGFNVWYPIFYPGQDLQAPQKVYRKRNRDCKQHTNSNGYSTTRDLILSEFKLGQIAENEKAIAKNAVAIANNGEAIANNAVAIANNGKAIANNAVAIANNGKAIASLKLDVKKIGLNVTAILAKLEKLDDLPTKAQLDDLPTKAQLDDLPTKAQYADMHRSLQRIEGEVAKVASSTMQNKLALQRNGLRDPDEISEVNVKGDSFTVKNLGEFKISKISEFKGEMIRNTQVQTYYIKVKKDLKLLELLVIIEDEEHQELLQKSQRKTLI